MKCARHIGSNKEIEVMVSGLRKLNYGSGWKLSSHICWDNQVRSSYCPLWRCNNGIKGVIAEAPQTFLIDGAEFVKKESVESPDCGIFSSGRNKESQSFWE